MPVNMLYGASVGSCYSIFGFVISHVALIHIKKFLFA